MFEKIRKKCACSKKYGNIYGKNAQKMRRVWLGSPSPDQSDITLVWAGPPGLQPRASPDLGPGLALGRKCVENVEKIRKKMWKKMRIFEKMRRKMRRKCAEHVQKMLPLLHFSTFSHFCPHFFYIFFTFSFAFFGSPKSKKNAHGAGQHPDGENCIFSTLGHGPHAGPPPQTPRTPPPGN